MKKSKLLVIGIFLLIIVGCQKNQDTVTGNIEDKELDNLTDSGMPIVKEEIELEFFAGQAPATNKDWNDVMVFNEYKEMTNINIKWNMVPRESLEEKRNLALAGGSLPDAFHSAVVPPSDILKYGKQGMFIPLNDLIDEYAPNFKKILDENPDIKKSITFPDGNIYSFPNILSPDFLSVKMTPKPWINEQWLETLDLEMPKTTEEFYEYLKAVKEGDPNENGEADEIPYGSPSIEFLINYLYGSYGLATHGVSNSYIDTDPETDELRLFVTTNEYKELLQFVNKLYSEKLIDQSIFSIEHETLLERGADDIYGSTITNSPEINFGEVGGSFTGMPPLEGPDGDRTYVQVNPSAANQGAFLITSENEHPAATVRWVDYFYSDEGMKLFFMGLEGETYEEKEDGTLEYMDHITNSKDGLTLVQEQAKYFSFPGGGYPSVIDQKYFRGAENASDELEAAKILEPYLIDEPWGPFIYTEEENERLEGLGNDIEKYIEEMRDKFIAGETSFSEWDKYVDTLESMNLDEYMGIKEDAYHRYKDN